MTTAIELADAEGLGAVSMSKVASRLGFTTMSLAALGETPLTETEKLSTMLLIDAHVFSDLQFGTPSAAETVGDDPYPRPGPAALPGAAEGGRGRGVRPRRRPGRRP
ncbi:MAG: hypothetical protein ACRDTF_04030 [Pseudonocardiaceae bacterium]